MNEVDGVRFDLKKSEIASLEKLGLVPMVKEYGKVMAFSAKTFLMAITWACRHIRLCGYSTM